MIKIVWLTLLLCLAHGNNLIRSAINSALTPEDIMDGKIQFTDKRFPTFKLAMELIRIRQHKNIIETGTSRRGDRNCLNDGCFTVLFSRWAELNQISQVVSVDISEAAVIEAKDSVRQFNCTSIVLQDSVQFLRAFPEPIDFLYLDTMDFDSNNPRPSQEQALKEIIAAYPKLHEASVVMVDDCGLAYGGKCAFVELFLKELGWRTLLKSYQLIMVTQAPVLL